VPHQRPRIGLALGSGSARGWAHIGVIRALEAAGFAPDIVCGTSIGALVGAAFAAGAIERLQPWVESLTWQGVMSLLDVRVTGGLIEGNRLVECFRERFEDPGIGQLARPFGCVATELATGHEVWLREGPVIEAVRASIALPGLLTPAVREGRLLVDGGLVNPVPVSLCRAMGADIVIAVDLNWDLIGRRHKITDEAASPQGAGAGLLDAMFAKFRGAGAAATGEMPSMLDVLTTSLNIMQVRITQSRLAGEPADVMIRPRLSGIAAMDYHRAAPAIAEGKRAAQQALPLIADLLG
jgi:NTE family protein